MRAKIELARSRLNAMENVRCREIDSGLMAFPEIIVPEKAKVAAKESECSPDEFYVMHALEKAGLGLVPGADFRQKPGSHHFRMSLLPKLGEMEEVLDRLEQFNRWFSNKFA